MSAREQLLAALAGSPEVRPGDAAELLVRNNDAELLRGGATAISGLPNSPVLGPGRADAVTLLRSVADVLDGGKDTGSAGGFTLPVPGSWVVEGRIATSEWMRVAGPYDRAEAETALAEYRHWYPADQVRLTPAPTGTAAAVTGPCRTKGCGQPEDEVDGSDPAMWGWICLHVGGTGIPLSWYCSPPCAHAAITRGGAELAAGDQAAVITDAAALDDTGLAPTTKAVTA